MPSLVLARNVADGTTKQRHRRLAHPVTPGGTGSARGTFWWARRRCLDKPPLGGGPFALTTDTVAGLLVLLITVLVDQVIRLRQVNGRPGLLHPAMPSFIQSLGVPVLEPLEPTEFVLPPPLVPGGQARERAGLASLPKARQRGDRDHDHDRGLVGAAIPLSSRMAGDLMVIGICHFPKIGGTRSSAGFLLRRIQPAEPGDTQSHQYRWPHRAALHPARVNRGVSRPSG